MTSTATMASDPDGARTSATAVDPGEFTAARREVERRRPADPGAVNHNDLRAFMHQWWAAFDHIAPVDFFLAHLDDADMTFVLDGEPLATDHASFRTWYASVPSTIPWDFHDVLDGVTLTGTVATGWTAEYFIRHVGEFHDVPIGQPGDGPGRVFNRVLRVTWQVEHDGERFVIRRYELAVASNAIPL